MPLKINPEHLATMRAAIRPLDTKARREQYVRGEIPRAGAVKNLAMRYRWDLLSTAFSSVQISALYLYLDDDHIDSALRRILGMDHRAALDVNGALS